MDLTERGLDGLGLSDIQAADVQMIDSVEHMESLTRIGKTLAKRDVRGAHFQ